MISKQQLLQLIESETEQHLALHQSLIRSPSPNPPGDTRAALDVVRQFLNSQGIEFDIIAPREDCPNLVSLFRAGESSRNGRRSIVLNGHLDQFPVGAAEQWKRDPYSGDIEDGFIHGRSGVDMKAGTTASVLAFAYLHRFRSQLQGRCTLEVVSDEETGGRWGTRYLIEEDSRKDQWTADCVLIGEPGGLESIRFGEKGTLRMIFKVTAEGFHGAYIHRSEGAIRIASRFIERLVSLESHPGEGMDEHMKRYMQRTKVRALADQIMGDGAADAMLIPTVNIGTIEGGVKINMIPSECTFEAEIRLPIGVRTEHVRARIDRIIAQDFSTSVTYTVIEHHSHVPTHSPPDHDVIGILQANAELVGIPRPIPICSLGATDSKYFRRNNVPAYAYGPSPKGMAEIDEKVSIDEFKHLVKIHTLTAWDYLGGP